MFKLSEVLAPKRPSFFKKAPGVKMLWKRDETQNKDKQLSHTQTKFKVWRQFQKWW